MSTTVNQISQLLHDSLMKAEQSLTFRNDPAFNKTLNIGQIIKGKVLRHYEGNHYSVNFNGQEKVVDSAVPLKAGELVYGRVVGLGDKVKLQRVFVDEKTGEQIQQQANSQQQFEQLSAKERMLQQLFARYQENLSAHDRQIVLKQLNRVAQPDVMALSSLVLKKVGLAQDPGFLQAIFRQLNNGEQKSLNHNKALLNVQADPSGVVHDSNSAVQALVALLSELSELDNVKVNLSQPDLQMDSESQSGKDHSDSEFNQMMLGRRILNTQNDGAVDHWYTSIPIWVNGKIVEINMVLFNQHQSASVNEFGVQHKKIVFSLETDFLGRVEITVVCANRNLRIYFTTNNDFAADYMSRYIKEVKEGLKQKEWNVEEINYGVAEDQVGNGVVRSVVEHHITKDSLNHLI